MTDHTDSLHYGAVPKRVKDQLCLGNYNEAIISAVDFYQEYDMCEAFKLILSDILEDSHLSNDFRLDYIKKLAEIIILFYPNSLIGKMGKTTLLCRIAEKVENLENNISLMYYRHALSSLFSLFEEKKLKDKEAILKTVVSGFKRLGFYSKKKDELTDPIARSLLLKLRVQFELPRGLLCARKPFAIDENS